MVREVIGFDPIASASNRSVIVATQPRTTTTTTTCTVNNPYNEAKEMATDTKEESLSDVFTTELMSESAAINDDSSSGRHPPQQEQQHAGFMTSFNHHNHDSMRDDSHYEVSSAREIMTRRCIRDGDARFAVKALMKKDLKELEFAQGRLDLAIEVKYLQALNHPNIVKLRGLYATDDPLHPSYFFIMDRLYGTLGMRIQEWKLASSKIEGKIYRRQDKILTKDLLVTRLTVAFDIVSAVKYMHARDLLHR